MSSPPFVRLPIEIELRDLLTDAKLMLNSADVEKDKAAELAVRLLDCGSRVQAEGFPFSARSAVILARELSARFQIDRKVD